jgi:hypothetical protein
MRPDLQREYVRAHYAARKELIRRYREEFQAIYQAEKLQRGLAPRPAAQCGTYSGCIAHYQHGERPCESCLKARRAHDREYRRKKQAVS